MCAHIHQCEFVRRLHVCFSAYVCRCRDFLSYLGQWKYIGESLRSKGTKRGRWEHQRSERKRARGEISVFFFLHFSFKPLTASVTLSNFLSSPFSFYHQHDSLKLVRLFLLHICVGCMNAFCGQSFCERSLIKTYSMLCRGSFDVLNIHCYCSFSFARMVGVVLNSHYDVVVSLCLNGTHAGKIGVSSAQG